MRLLCGSLRSWSSCQLIRSSEVALTLMALFRLHLGTVALLIPFGKDENE